MTQQSDFAEYLEYAFKITEVGSIVAYGILFVRKMGQDSSKLESKMDSQTARVEATLAQQNVVVGELKEDIKALNNVVTQVAVQTQRLDQMSERMNRQDKLIDELRREGGWVTKNTRGGVDGEYNP